MQDENLVVRLTCPFCGEGTVVVRELPHRVHGLGYVEETSEVECLNCRAEIVLVARKKEEP